MKKDTPPSLLQHSLSNQRVIGLDILRIFLALCIYFFHSIIHVKCDYGLLNDFFASSTLAMTGFFMLSGYALQLAYGKKDLTVAGNTKPFYLKRFISIYPLYIIVGTLSVSISIVSGSQSLGSNIALLPVEILGIQSIFDGALFQYSHNSGSWFISCILICYFTYPLLQAFVTRLKHRHVVIGICFLVLLLSYIHILPTHFKCGVLYTNVFIKVMEFTLGMLIAKFNIEQISSSRLIRVLRSVPSLFLFSAILVLGYSFINHYELHGELLVYVCLVMIFISLGSMQFSNKVQQSKFILYASSITYAFYLSQFLVWKPSKMILSNISDPNRFVVFGCTLSACILVSVALHELVEKPASKYLKKKIM